MRILVTGAGGFIGGHLAAALLARGDEVTAADIAPLKAWHQVHEGARNLPGLDLRHRDACEAACRGADAVLHFAADMGGMGFIEPNKAACSLNTLIDLHMLLAARDAGVHRFTYASTACVYRHNRQDTPEPVPLREAVDVYPADPEDGYGWAKLYAERVCRHFAEDYGLPVRVARLHSVYGPHGTWDGGREKVPAALCRKVAAAVRHGERSIEIWGDGEQTRSFLYIADAVEGILALHDGSYGEAVNIGSDRLISVTGLARIVEAAAGVRLEHVHVPGPLGVRGRSADLRRARRVLGWSPSVSLEEGIARTYAWVSAQAAAS